MGSIFLTVLRMSLEASLLVAVVLGFRVIFRKAPKWLHCLIWTIVAVKLICPFAIERDWGMYSTLDLFVYMAKQDFQNEISPGQSMNLIITERSETEEGKTNHGDTISPEKNENDNTKQAGKNAAQDNIIEKAEYFNHVEYTPIESRFLRIMRICGYVWLGGTVLIAAYGLYSVIGMKRRLADAVQVDDRIFRSDRISTAFLFGIIRPGIYIPFGISDENLIQVREHELAHLRRGDHIAKVIAFLLVTVYWFNPVIWLAYLLYCRDMELACDERVIRDKDTEERKAYSSALVECSQQQNAFRVHSTIPVKFGELAVKKRVLNVLNKKKPAVVLMITAILFILITALLNMTKEHEIDLFYSPDIPDSYCQKVYEQYFADVKVPEKLDRAISEALITDSGESISYVTVDGKTYRYVLFQNYVSMSDESDVCYSACGGEGHLVLGFEEGERSAKVYLMGEPGDYRFENGFLVGGCAANPYVMLFDKDSSGNYIFKEQEGALDGELYEDSLNELFPKEVAEKYWEIYDDTYVFNAVGKLIGKQCDEYAEGYLKAIGRTAKIKDFDDTFVTNDLSLSYGISDEVSNGLMAMYNEYNLLATTCGNIEVWENGIHCVYLTAWEGGCNGEGIVTYLKYEYDTGRIYQKDRYRVSGDSITCIEGNDRTDRLIEIPYEPEIHIPGVPDSYGGA